VAIKNIFIVGRYPEQTNLSKVKLSDLGITDARFSKSEKEADLILYFDIVNGISSDPLVKKVLIRQEPEIVLPNNYKKKYTSKFDQIISVGRDSNHVGFSVNWPQIIPKQVKLIKNRDPNKVVLINRNLLNFKSPELYSLRREVCFKSNQIDLYGFGWNIPATSSLKTIMIEVQKFLKKPTKIKLSGARYFLRKQKNYKGVALDKIEVMQQYKIALIIENSPIYVSEKLFDSFAAGCIPIYVGPNLDYYDIPDSLYLQSDSNYKSIINNFKVARCIDYELWLSQLNDWLSANRTYENWSKEFFLKRIIDLIKD
jgi:alpha(1,3/1,4) fucosyltransferase